MAEQTRPVSVLVRRALALTAVLGFVVIVLGCMSLTIGGRTELVQSEDGCVAQHGDVTIPGNQELDVYYPIPYPVPPNLVISDCLNCCKIVAQCPDHFRVKNEGALARDITWKARGVRMTAPVVPVPPPVLPPVAPAPGPASPPNLPAEPISIDPTTKP
jgi:hypothetical protein